MFLTLFTESYARVAFSVCQVTFVTLGLPLCSADGVTETYFTFVFVW